MKLNEILSSTSQPDHVFIVGDLNINLLDPTAIENDDIRSNQLYDTFNGIFLLDIADHYPIFTIVPINCFQKRTRV